MSAGHRAVGWVRRLVLAVSAVRWLEDLLFVDFFEDRLEGVAGLGFVHSLAQDAGLEVRSYF